MDRDPEFVAILGKPPRDVDAHPLLDVVEDLLVAGLVADEQQPQSVVAQYLQRRARHIGLGVARPGHAELAELAGDRLGARPVIGKRVVVEEELLHLREIALCEADFVDDMTYAAYPVAVAANGLRPETKGTFRPAAAARIQRDVGVLQIADEVVFNPQIALVDFGDEGQLIHLFQDRPIAVVGYDAVRAAKAQTVYCIVRPAFRDLFDRKIEFLAGDKIDGRRSPEAVFRLDRNLGADKSDLELRIHILECLSDPEVGGEGRC